jgi:hypothetical protein
MRRDTSRQGWGVIAILGAGLGLLLWHLASPPTPRAANESPPNGGSSLLTRQHSTLRADAVSAGTADPSPMDAPLSRESSPASQLPAPARPHTVPATFTTSPVWQLPHQRGLPAGSGLSGEPGDATPGVHDLRVRGGHALLSWFHLPCHHRGLFQHHHPPLRAGGGATRGRDL